MCVHHNDKTVVFLMLKKKKINFDILSTNFFFFRKSDFFQRQGTVSDREFNQIDVLTESLFFSTLCFFFKQSGEIGGKKTRARRQYYCNSVKY